LPYKVHAIAEAWQGLTAAIMRGIGTSICDQGEILSQSIGAKRMRCAESMAETVSNERLTRICARVHGAV
jgi:hypothetical protein